MGLVYSEDAGDGDDLTALTQILLVIWKRNTVQREPLRGWRERR